MSGRDTRARSEVLGVKGGEQWSSLLPLPSHPPPHCCGPYPLVHPTSIPLQFLSTFCSPLKEIGFKPWHTLAPQIDLILPHPGDIPLKRRPTFFSSFPPFHFNLFPISHTIALYIMCPSISYPLLLFLLSSFSIPHLSILNLILFFPVHASLSVSCLCDIQPPSSAWWTGATGFWWSNLLTKTGWHQKKKGGGGCSQVIALRTGTRERKVCVGVHGERGWFSISIHHHGW